MRRTYIKPGKSKTSSVKEEALKQLRQTRAKIKEDHPDLLGVMREKILGMHSERPADHTIDKQKNISTVMKFLETKSDNKAMDIAIKAMLAKHAKE